MGRKKQERIEVLSDESVVSKKAIKNTEQTYWGKEPVWNPLNTDKETENELGPAFSWYMAMTEEKQKKDFLIKYVEKFLPEFTQVISKVSKDEFASGEAHVVAILARIIMKGAQLSQKRHDYVSNGIKKLSVKYSKTSTDSVAIKELPKLPTRDPKVSEFIGVIDGMIDDFGLHSPKKQFPDASMADVVFKRGGTAGQRSQVHEHFAPFILELHQAVDGKNPDIKEAYALFTKVNMKRVYGWLTAPASENVVQNAKSKKPKKKKKAKTAKQILSKFSCKLHDPDLKVTSIEPETILGAEQLWIFNTKTRKLGVYFSKDDTGLNISRKSITNYDEARSVHKKIRKPEEVVPGILTLGKVPLRKVLDNIRAVAAPMKNRIGNDTLLLRVVK